MSVVTVFGYFKCEQLHCWLKSLCYLSNPYDFIMFSGRIDFNSEYIMGKAFLGEWEVKRWINQFEPSS